MTTLTIKINERSKKGKAFLEFAKIFFDNEKDVEIIESDSKKTMNEEPIYNPEFVKMILDRDAAIKSGKSKCITVDATDIWGSLGLK